MCLTPHIEGRGVTNASLTLRLRKYPRGDADRSPHSVMILQTLLIHLSNRAEATTAAAGPAEGPKPEARKAYTSKARYVTRILVLRSNPVAFCIKLVFFASLIITPEVGLTTGMCEGRVLADTGLHHFTGDRLRTA
jgi:hypothetical protein